MNSSMRWYYKKESDDTLSFIQYIHIDASIIILICLLLIDYSLQLFSLIYIYIDIRLQIKSIFDCLLSTIRIICF